MNRLFLLCLLATSSIFLNIVVAKESSMVWSDSVLSSDEKVSSGGIYESNAISGKYDDFSVKEFDDDDFLGDKKSKKKKKRKKKRRKSKRAKYKQEEADFRADFNNGLTAKDANQKADDAQRISSKATKKKQIKKRRKSKRAKYKQEAADFNNGLTAKDTNQKADDAQRISSKATKKKQIKKRRKSKRAKYKQEEADFRADFNNGLTAKDANQKADDAQRISSKATKKKQIKKRRKSKRAKYKQEEADFNNGLTAKDANQKADDAQRISSKATKKKQIKKRRKSRHWVENNKPYSRELNDELYHGGMEDKPAHALTDAKKSRSKAYSNRETDIKYAEIEQGLYDATTYRRSRETREVSAPVVYEKNSSNIVVYFDFNSSKLSQKYKSYLSNKLKLLNSLENVKIHLAGHTDNRGSESYNKKLGLERALAVSKYLQTKGINKKAIDVHSYGETNPAYDNNSSLQSKNRRVEIIEKLKQNIKKNSAYFGFDNSKLSSENRKNLNKDLKYLLKNKKKNILLEGHTDIMGSREYNKKLGKKRGQSVSKYLQKHGVDASRIEVVSYGEDAAATDSVDTKMWSKYRRVDIIY